MSAREAETRRRRRQRREARARAYREWVCGGPLVDVAEPIVSDGDDDEHWEHVQQAMAVRSLRVTIETQLLAADFPRRCNARAAVRARMWPELRALIDRLPGPNAVPTHSTSTAVPAPRIPRV